MSLTKLGSLYILLVSVAVLLAPETSAAQIVATNSGNNYQQLIPNAFTVATWSIPSLQNYLRIPIHGYKAAEIFFNAVDDFLIKLGHPSHATFANIVGQNLARFDQFSIASYLLFKGEAVQKFLTSEGLITDVSLPQRYAGSLENAVKSSVVTDIRSLLLALLDGYNDFIQSLGYNFNEKAYILAVLFNQEVLVYQKHLKA